MLKYFKNKINNRHNIQVPQYDDNNEELLDFIKITGDSEIYNKPISCFYDKKTQGVVIYFYKFPGDKIIQNIDSIKMYFINKNNAYKLFYETLINNEFNVTTITYLFDTTEVRHYILKTPLDYSIKDQEESIKEINNKLLLNNKNIISGYFIYNQKYKQKFYKSLKFYLCISLLYTIICFSLLTSLIIIPIISFITCIWSYILYRIHFNHEMKLEN